MLALQAHHMLDWIMLNDLPSLPDQPDPDGPGSLCHSEHCTPRCVRTDVLPGKMWMESERPGSQSCMKASLQATFMLMRWFCTCNAISSIQRA